MALNSMHYDESETRIWIITHANGKFLTFKSYSHYKSDWCNLKL